MTRVRKALMKCIVCDGRKAKRPCPANRGSICAPCCGEKRVLEIDCPETCAFLRAGREHESAEFGKLLRAQDRGRQEKSRKILSEHQDVVAYLEYTIAQLRLASRDLSDGDVSRAVDMLLDTYRTEDKGVLYEKKADDLRVESVRQELRRIVEAFRNPEEKGEEGIIDPKRARLPLGGAIECLEFVQSMISVFSGSGRSANSYLNFLARMTPKRENRSSIIMP
jgi:hypothetical protein